MENNTGTEGTISNNPATQLKETLSQNAKEYKPAYHSVTLTCNIRRKPGYKGLPGTLADDRNNKIGSSFDKQTGKTLKGVTGELEDLIMPNIISVNPNAPEFRRLVDEYWKNISVIVPPDNENFAEHERGLICKVTFIIQTDAVKAQYDKLESLQEKIEFIQRGLVAKKGPENAKHAAIVLDYESIPNFLLLCYCLKYSKVANKLADINLSAKIQFFLYEKTSSISARFNRIQVREKAHQLFAVVQDDEKRVDALLLAFKLNPHDYESLMEKVIALDDQYNENDIKMSKFVEEAEDENWETKYLILLSVRLGKLTNPVNTSAYYYNSILLGKDMKEAVLRLNNGTEESENIKTILIQETSLAKRTYAN